MPERKVNLEREVFFFDPDISSGSKKNTSLSMSFFSFCLKTDLGKKSV